METIVKNLEAVSPDEDFGGIPEGAYGYVIEENSLAYHVEFHFSEYHKIPNITIECGRGAWVEKSSVQPVDQWINTTHNV